MSYRKNQGFTVSEHYIIAEIVKGGLNILYGLSVRVCHLYPKTHRVAKAVQKTIDSIELLRSVLDDDVAKKTDMNHSYYYPRGEMKDEDISAAV